ncbi:DUF3859 domain-containing protein [Mariniblastus sp.]|nr:DUF3859 domain-containing protein [Mariniblastus sp.]
MAKRKPEIRLRSYGIYDSWNSQEKALPKIKEFTLDVPAVVDIEFGFIVNIKGAKNQQLDFCIDHPGIMDDQGLRRAPFDGSEYIKTNDWNFYLGDTIWLPIADKLGPWRMTVELGENVIAEKVFNVRLPVD